MTIERDDREHLAAVIRELLNGEVTADEVFARSRRSGDRGVRELAEQAWLIHQTPADVREDAVKTNLKRETKQDLRRWLLFLESDLEYRWPTLPKWARVAGFIPSVLTFGAFWWPYRRWYERRGDAAFWPFLTRADYEKARASSRHR